ncbi:MAG: hypothetical protein KAG61_11385, partial [Bacteriovoracaceae bacterium]|nr:hypothetical protein [Bacteriovoracaceae bacterium]
METDITISADNRERLERYLARCERKLDHLTPSERSSLIADLRAYLLMGDQSELGKKLLQNRDVVALVNPFLINKGLPLIRTKKRGIFLYV